MRGIMETNAADIGECVSNGLIAWKRQGTIRELEKSIDGTDDKEEREGLSMAYLLYIKRVGPSFDYDPLVIQKAIETVQSSSNLKEFYGGAAEETISDVRVMLRCKLNIQG
jgi:hypothetical protein